MQVSDRLESLLKQVAIARDCGLDAVFASQHFLSWPVQTLQPIPLLGRLAAEAGDMNIGTGILLLPLFNPVDVAEQIATLDSICRGHFIFGVGLGYEEEEFRAFALDRKTRGARFEESLSLIKRLWKDDVVTFSGKFFSLSEVKPTARPIQKPHPEIWVAGNNHPAVRRAARLGDTWFGNPQAKLSTLEMLMKTFKATLDEVGKPTPRHLPLIREVYLEKDRERALQRSRPFIEERYKVYTQQGQDKQLPEGENLNLPFHELAKDRFIIGNANDFFREIENYKKFGFNYFVLEYEFLGMGTDMVFDFLNLISNEILPSL